MSHLAVNLTPDVTIPRIPQALEESITNISGMTNLSFDDIISPNKRNDNCVNSKITPTRKPIDATPDTFSIEFDKSKTKQAYNSSLQAITYGTHSKEIFKDVS